MLFSPSGHEDPGERAFRSYRARPPLPAQAEEEQVRDTAGAELDILPAAHLSRAEGVRKQTVRLQRECLGRDRQVRGVELASRVPRTPARPTTKRLCQNREIALKNKGCPEVLAEPLTSS